jgi:hypothetical protein
LKDRIIGGIYLWVTDVEDEDKSLNFFFNKIWIYGFIYLFILNGNKFKKKR